MENKDDLMRISDVVMKNGHFLFVKFDGERIDQRITVIIDYPPNLKMKMIKEEGDNLGALLTKAFNRYLR